MSRMVNLKIEELLRIERDKVSFQRMVPAGLSLFCIAVSVLILGAAPAAIGIGGVTLMGLVGVGVAGFGYSRARRLSAETEKLKQSLERADIESRVNVPGASGQVSPMLPASSRIRKPSPSQGR